MNKFEHTRLTSVFKSVFSGLIVSFSFMYASAATIDWKGGTSIDWATPSNWSSGTVPVSTDNVRIGVVSFSSQPTISDARFCASLTFGVVKSITLTVNTATVSPLTGLAVGGNIVQNPLGLGLPAGLLTTLAGTGFISCGNFQVGNSTTTDVLFVNNLIVVSKINSLNISGDLDVYSTDISVAFVGIGQNNAAFSLQGGTTNVGGQLLTSNTKLGVIPIAPKASPTLSIDMPSGSALTPVLTLSNASAINASSVSSSIDFYDNTGGTGTCTVYYNGASQTVYTNTTAALNTSPSTYQYLLLTGTGTKTPNGGSLTVAQDMTSTTNAVAFNTNNPIVTVGGNWTNNCNATQGTGNITVTGSVTNNSGGTLALGSANFTIGANYTNNAGGTYTQSTGITFFSGTGSQALVDYSAGGTMFKKVTFNGAGTSTINSGTGNFSVASTGLLSMVGSAQLTAGSTSAAYLTLKSDTSGAATVAAIPSASGIAGFVTVQRFVQGNATYLTATQRWKGRNYRLMSSPVNEGADASSNVPYSLNYLAAGTIVTDCTSTLGTIGGNPSLYLFNDVYTPSNVSFTSGNFIGVTNISSTAASGTISTTDATTPTTKIYQGEGFMMYFRGDNVTHTTGTPSKTSYPFVAPESVTFSTTGNLNQGTISVISWTGTAGLMNSTTNPGNAAVMGYNLVGNPYASSIDWHTFSNSNPAAPIYGFHVNPTIYFFNPYTSQYDSYNATTNLAGGIASNIVPSGQGVFVQANGASPTLTFTENAKVTSQLVDPNLELGIPAGSSIVQQLFRLRLLTDSSNYDDIAVAFNSAASANYNSNEDSKYLPGINAAEGLASFSADNVALSINSLPLPKQNPEVIKLDVEVRASGMYSLKRTQLDDIPKIYQVWLMDNYKKDSLDIRNNDMYAFNVNLSDTASFGSNRFSIVIRQDPALNLHLLNFTAAKTSSGSQVTWKTENEQNYTNFTVERSIDNGTTFIVLAGFISDASGSYSFLDKNPLIGSDQYRLKMDDLNNVITYSHIVTLNYSNSDNINGSNISVYPNPAANMINLAINQTSTNDTRGLSTVQNAAHALKLNAPPKSNTITYNIQIINITGSVVKTATSLNPAWQDNVSNLSPGTYIIKVVDKSNNTMVGKAAFTKL